MLKVFVTQAIITKGGNDRPAINISRNGEIPAAWFRIGKRLYDSKAENNTRWLNYTVKAFGSIVDRVEQMKLKEGAFVNIVARLDEEEWTDKNTNAKRTAPIFILDDIEYCSTGSKSNQSSEQNTGATTSAPVNQAPQAAPVNQAPQAAPAATGVDTGYEPFPGGQPFFNV